MKDELLDSLQKKHPLKQLEPVKNPFNYLVKSIVYQQLSTKAASTIYDRLINLFQNQNIIIGDLSMLTVDELKNVGLSRQKASYLHFIDQAFLQDDFGDFDWLNSTDTEIINKLTQIKGVGEWTAQMVLIFALNRPDVWPVKDLGVKNAFIKHIGYKNKGKLLETEMELYSQKWKGYRSKVARLFWASQG